jgi:hypothetical protein
MKISFLFLVIFALAINQQNCKVKQSEIVAAISEILKNFYALNDRRVDILCFECDKNLLEMVNTIAKCHQTEKISFRTMTRNKTNWKKQENRIWLNSTVAIFKNFKNFSFFDKTAIYKNDFDSNNLHHVIYIRDKMKIDSLEYSYINNNYLVGNGEGKQLSLATFMIQRKIPMKCPMKMETINRFNKMANQWENKVFFPRKFDDLNGCEIDFGTSFQLNSVSWKTNKITNEYFWTGPLYEINRAITDKLNIFVMYHVCQSEGDQLEVKCKNPDVKPAVIIDSKYVGNLTSGPYINLQLFNFEMYLGLFIPPGND